MRRYQANLVRVRRKPFALVLFQVIAALLALPAPAAFHLWDLNEVYTDNTGTLQFIEMFTIFGGQTLTAGAQISVTDLGNTTTHTFTLSTNLPLDSANQSLLFGTAGVHAAGAPTPNFIIPNGFLFAAGGTISFFGANPGAYSALPTDGTLSRTWGGGNAANSPKNLLGQTGQVSVPEPGCFVLMVLGVVSCVAFRGKGKRQQ